MSSNIITKKLWISNMACVNCENIIEQELWKLNGMKAVKVSYSSGTATVTYDEAIINLDAIIAEIEKLDYFVRKDNNPGLMKNSQITEGLASNERENEDGKMNKKTINKKPVGKVNYTEILAIGIIVFAFYILANRFGLFTIFQKFPAATEGMGYGMLFLIGVLTSVHCVAMCGGICLSQCAPQKQAGGKESKFMAMRPSLLYNLGRVISYTVIGGIVGAIGGVISFSGTMKGIVQILAGVFMVIMGLNMLNVFPWLRKFNPRMPKVFAKKINEQKQSNSPFYIGMLNGLMPCGPLQAMQLYALSTGSPIKGAISMLLFSMGTVPLMFAFGALSSFLNKKYTAKMLKVSAVLVLILGVFMLNNGIGLSGISLPVLSSVTSPASAGTGQKAVVEDGVQVVTTSLDSGRYEPIIVQKGIPVKWIIQAEEGDINGCNNSIVVQKYDLQKSLAVGDNVIEFTPMESGVIPFSCWMGMIRSKITVVDDLSNIGSTSTSDNISSSTEDKGSTGIGSGSCCTSTGTASSNSSRDNEGANLENKTNIKGKVEDIE